MSQSQVNSTFWCKQAELWNYLHWTITTLWVCMCDLKELTDDAVGSTADLTRVHLGQSIRECNINTDEVKIIIKNQNC